MFHFSQQLHHSYFSDELGYYFNFIKMGCLYLQYVMIYWYKRIKEKVVLTRDASYLSLTRTLNPSSSASGSALSQVSLSNRNSSPFSSPLLIENIHQREAGGKDRPSQYKSLMRGNSPPAKLGRTPY